MANKKLLSWLAFIACLVAICVIGLGAFTRLIDAGLGCPDWPGCYGHLTAPQASLVIDTHYQTYKAWSEMIHRYFAGTLSTLILVIVILSFIRRSNMKAAVILIALVVYQIILGMLTVTLKLLPIIVTQHLLGGFLILSTLWIIALNNNIKLQNKLSPTMVFSGIFFAALIALGILFGQIFLGAWTSTNYASLSCTDFPFCLSNQNLHWSFMQAFNLISPVGVNYEGGTLPETVRQTIQMTHRVGALIFTLYILFFAVLLKIKNIHNFEITKSLFIILGLLAVQLCLGISNILFKLPTVVAVSHTIVASLLLLAVVSLTYKTAYWRKKA